jgi:hypothetical protein
MALSMLFGMASMPLIASVGRYSSLLTIHSSLLLNVEIAVKLAARAEGIRYTVQEAR